ncbi:hypothetical protein [Lacticaseibacillus paracasei]|jgi:hypothetical protein|uniref:hypothetical protein n=1 Tax=Lacticaseibacillus paracasei TaxID=1597 RepID=UPI002068E2AC|nr:hypothetical protein [Lacticaseibacillus paracasei]MCP9305804.1 hypothetical protein [Lacticaseibacillus paracasei]DAL68239.1 MAG TPA: SprT-like family protein [Caudoviricetes sp.]
MQLPKSVLIDDVEYTVSTASSDELQKEVLSPDNIIGACNYNNQTIKISDSINEGNVKVTLLHEIIHAILSERGLNDQCEDEMLVDNIAHAIRMLAKQNPELIKEVLS